MPSKLISFYLYSIMIELWKLISAPEKRAEQKPTKQTLFMAIYLIILLLFPFSHFMHTHCFNCFEIILFIFLFFLFSDQIKIQSRLIHLWILEHCEIFRESGKGKEIWRLTYNNVVTTFHLIYKIQKKLTKRKTKKTIIIIMKLQEEA